MSSNYFLIEQSEDGDVSYTIFEDKEALLNHIKDHNEGTDNYYLDKLMDQSMELDDALFDSTGSCTFYSSSNLPILIIKGELVSLTEKKVVTEFDVE